MTGRRYTDRAGRRGFQVWLLVIAAGCNIFSSLAGDRSRRLRLWVLGVGTLAMIAVWVAERVIQAHRLRASASWPSAAGAVQYARVRRVGDSLRGSYAVDTAYSFMAGSERYGGYAERLFRREHDADAEAARLRNATAVVKYDPRNPELSLLT